jgi:hypothetical protein
MIEDLPGLESIPNNVENWLDTNVTLFALNEVWVPVCLDSCHSVPKP